MLNFILVMIATMLCTSACMSDTEDISSNMEKFKEWQRVANENIRALQEIVQAVQDGVRVTEVKDAYDPDSDDEYMYTWFYLEKQLPIKITQDVPGAEDNEEDAGYTPLIGIKLYDGDSRYYWTVDGSWLLDSDGRRIPVASVAGESSFVPIIQINKRTGKWEILYNKRITKNLLSAMPLKVPLKAVFSDCKQVGTNYELTFVGGGSISIPKYAPEAEINETIDLTLRVPQPEAGELPVSSFESSKYSGTVVWDPDATATGNGAFKNGMKYTATVTVTAKEGYSFVLTDGGIRHDKADVKYGNSNAAKVIVCTLTFPETGMGTGMDREEEINSIDLTDFISMPVAGIFPPLSFTVAGENGDYCSAEVLWYYSEVGFSDRVEEGFFRQGVQYRAFITLTPAKGYTFGENAITVTHSDAATSYPEWFDVVRENGADTPRRHGNIYFPVTQ
ncbi:MAG: DUF4988 domain-containing protein [Proteiniphilum sp.]|nr:DUF4988 domain-containing protein [Proteiniphilum sp.]